MKIRFRGGTMHGIDIEFVTMASVVGPIKVNGESYVENGNTDGDYTIFEVVRPL